MINLSTDMETIKSIQTGLEEQIWVLGVWCLALRSVLRQSPWREGYNLKRWGEETKEEEEEERGRNSDVWYRILYLIKAAVKVTKCANNPWEQ